MPDESLTTVQGYGESGATHVASPRVGATYEKICRSVAKFISDFVAVADAALKLALGGGSGIASVGSGRALSTIATSRS